MRVKVSSYNWSLSDYSYFFSAFGELYVAQLGESLVVIGGKVVMEQITFILHDRQFFKAGLSAIASLNMVKQYIRQGLRGMGKRLNRVGGHQHIIETCSVPNGAKSSN